MTQPPTNKRIARQKKAQAAFSLTGGTLGLAALASRGRAAQVTRRGGAGAFKAAEKLKDRSTALTTAGAGVGGVGAYNFASYTNAEAKKQQKLKKNMDPFEIHKRREDDSLNEAEGAALGGLSGLAASHPSGMRDARRGVDRSRRYNRLNHMDKVINPAKGIKMDQTKVQMARRGAKLYGKKVGPVVAGGAALGALGGHGLQRLERKREQKGIAKNMDPFEVEKKGISWDEVRPAGKFLRAKTTRFTSSTAGKTTKASEGGGLTSLGSAVAIGAAGGAGVGIGAASQKRKQKNAFAKSDPFEVNKLGSPKVRFQDLTTYEQGTHHTTRHDSERVSTRYKGKSLILRRPKYQVVASPSDAKIRRSSYATATPNLRIKGEAADAFVEANRKKSKTVKLGNRRFKHEVAKANRTSAFGIDHGA
jgi:hypothetical protein